MTTFEECKQGIAKKYAIKEITFYECSESLVEEIIELYAKKHAIEFREFCKGQLSIYSDEQLYERFLKEGK